MTPRNLVFSDTSRYTCVLHDRSRDPAGMDYAYADARALELVTQRLRKPTHRKLTRRIRCLLGRRHDAIHTREINYARVFARSQQWQKSARHAHHAPEVDLEEPLEVFVCDVEMMPRYADTIDQLRGLCDSNFVDVGECEVTAAT